MARLNFKIVNNGLIGKEQNTRCELFIGYGNYGNACWVTPNNNSSFFLKIRLQGINTKEQVK